MADEIYWYRYEDEIRANSYTDVDGDIVFTGGYTCDVVEQTYLQLRERPVVYGYRNSIPFQGSMIFEVRPVGVRKMPKGSLPVQTSLPRSKAIRPERTTKEKSSKHVLIM